MTRRRPHAHAEDDFTTYPKDAGTEGLALFSQQPIEEPPAPESERSIDERFAAFHAAHPEVYSALEWMAMRAFREGRSRIGVGALVEQLRSDVTVRTDRAHDFKINNSFRSRYADKLVADHPELDPMIERRTRRSA